MPRGRIPHDLIGNVYDRLTVISAAPRADDARRKLRWLCRCVCGETIIAAGDNLKNGDVRSCGCLKVETTRVRGLSNATHGHSRHDGSQSPEYRAWHAMKQRCLNPRNNRYKNYGGRGIRVCDQWINSFETFLADVGSRPSSEHSLDRYPDNNGHYEPSNVRWATAGEQARNRRQPQREAQQCRP